MSGKNREKITPGMQVLVVMKKVVLNVQVYSTMFKIGADSVYGQWVFRKTIQRNRYGSVRT